MQNSQLEERYLSIHSMRARLYLSYSVNLYKVVCTHVRDAQKMSVDTLRIYKPFRLT